MKTHAYNIAIAMFAISATIFGCKKESIMPIDSQPVGMESKKTVADVPLKDAGTQPVSAPIEKANTGSIKDNIVKGVWQVKLFIQDGSYGDMTPTLQEFTFKFNEFNVVLAEKNGKGFSGKWNFVDAGDQSKMIFDFGVQPLISMNDAWTPLAYNPKLVRLEKLGKNGMIHLDLVQISEEPLMIK